MRELARIQIRGDAKEFIDTWNAAALPTIEQRVAAVYKDEAAYSAMRRTYDIFAERHQMTWFEQVEVEYSKFELSKFEVLSVNIVGRAKRSDRESAPLYAENQLCSTCGRIRYVQLHNLSLDLQSKEDDEFEIDYSRHDICQTQSYEVVISRKLKILLEDTKVSGISILPIEDSSSGFEVSDRYYQLIINTTIGPLLPPTRIQRLDPCSTCGRFRRVLFDALPGTKESEYYFSKESYDGQPIVLTNDAFGRFPRFHSKLLISQPTYRNWIEHNVTGFGVQPAHLT